MRPVRRRHLPSLGALATFEVAAKHLSFTLAAKELNITQGAVSQQIRLLEKALEVALEIEESEIEDRVGELLKAIKQEREYEGENSDDLH